MDKKFYVIDQDGYLSSKEEFDAPESFKKREKAVKRATHISARHPGAAIAVVEVCDILLCEVGKPKRLIASVGKKKEKK